MVNIAPPRSASVAAALAVICTCAVGRSASGPSEGAVGRPAVLSDAGGAIREVVLHYVPGFAEELGCLYEDLFAALPVEVAVQVICPSAEDAEAFVFGWGADEAERGRRVEVINADRPITVWARDRLVAREDPACGAVATSIVPHDFTSYNDDHRNDLLVPLLLEDSGAGPRITDACVHVEGGNIVSNTRHAFVGANVLKENKELGLEPGRVKRELFDLLGRPYVLVGDEHQPPPWGHVDMYLTPIDDETVLVASPTMAYMLLCLRLGALDSLLDLLDSEMGPPLCSGSSFDQVAAQIAEYGYNIIRLPALADPDEEWMVTYNNVIMEQRDGQRIVYMPVYDIPELDQAAELVYRSLGFRVHPIDVSRIFQYGGAVRCLVNVTAREPLGVAAVRADSRAARDRICIVGCEERSLRAINSP
jgi:hypothetical protein